ncbi:hypothetical protein BZ163_09240 [Pseudomonas sp. VI4.1]|jgi:hypothetical protein|nr:hypothetical protein BZ163_09240 [Pseudomonas sp. VI4.1]
MAINIIIAASAFMMLSSFLKNIEFKVRRYLSFRSDFFVGSIRYIAEACRTRIVDWRLQGAAQAKPGCYMLDK